MAPKRIPPNQLQRKNKKNVSADKGNWGGGGGGAIACREMQGINMDIWDRGTGGCKADNSYM